MPDTHKLNSILSSASKLLFFMILMTLSINVMASDPRGLFWPVVIGLTVFGIVLFVMSTAVIVNLVKKGYLRSILIGFFFGLFLGPIYLPNGYFMLNSANLFFRNNGGLFSALAYASIYAVVFLVSYLVLIKKNRK
ncbi:hypothetical protein [Pseudoalteromonas denitrificans]|uniref:Uncharacterized protein n=1 Tax=Pseudoalteromonas denitrificans DSM 6059 TaxID=1123010 RepID=A0A1I1SUP8_9GAMM|nr:hypothetical protein [Pseudoalteromonas denitrificans]SFD50219.1 hypothetical protein SAMN02745724_04697 [Pseudoalteromonas denitrificans DSM 6059]